MPAAMQLVMNQCLITIFARKEPTTDPVARKYLAPGYVAKLSDVVFYKDKKCSEPYARWAHHCHPPRKGQKRVTLNCWQWAVEWVEMPGAACLTSMQSA
jgi:hypothetical protein